MINKNKKIERLDAFIKKSQFWRNDLPLPSELGERCIEEEILEDYLEHKLYEEDTKRIESHLADCHTCLTRLLILRDMRCEDVIEVPKTLIYTAKDLVRDHKHNCFELVLGIAKQAIYVIRTTGILLSPEPVFQPVRGMEDIHLKKTTDYVAAKQSFGDISIDIQLERINGSYKLMVNSLDNKTGHTPNNMRLVLYSMERELDSVDNSEAVFYIKLKSYLVKIIHSGEQIGNIRIDLRECDNTPPYFI